MISTFREIEKWRDATASCLSKLEWDEKESECLNGIVWIYNRVLDLLVMDHPCNVCEGEKWIMQYAESFNSSRRVHSPCRSCEGTGVCQDA